MYFVIHLIAVDNGNFILASENPSHDEILIAPNSILMPEGKILLIRKEGEYGAIKFLHYTEGDKDWYAEYECCYLTKKYKKSDACGFSIKKNKLHSPNPRGLGRFSFSFGNKEIKCGPFRLTWRGKGSVYFYGQDQREGDYGIALAPTVWDDFKQIDIEDEKLTWYKFDEKRERMAFSLEEFSKKWKK
jgi:hypothetical protein